MRFLLLFLVIGFIVYWNSLHGEFLGDDNSRILQAAPFFKMGLSETLANVLPDRPFLVFTNWLNFKMFGMSYIAFKVTNIFIHCLAGFALFRLLSLLSRRHFGFSDERLAAIMAILFIVHPVAGQSINIIIQRGVLLAGLFAITSMLFFLRFLDSRQGRDYLLCFFVFLLAVLSKPFVVTLPLIFAIYILLLRPEIKVRVWLKWILILIIPAIIPSVFLLMLRINKQFIDVTWYQYLIIQMRVIFIYLRLFILPFNLHYLYDITAEVEILKNLTWFAILGHLGILIIAKHLIKNRSVIAFSIFATYLAFLPESGVFPIMHLAFEHRTYYPYIFLFIGVWAFLASLNNGARRIAKLVLIAIIFLFSWLCFNRNSETNSLIKWLQHSYRYNQKDTSVNLSILEFYEEKHDRPSVEKMLNSILLKSPDEPYYIIWKKAYYYKAASLDEKRKTLELIANQLIENAQINFKDDLCLGLNFFVINRVPEVTSDVQAKILIEYLLAPQVTKFSKRMQKFGTLMEIHLNTLNYLRSYFEKRIVEKKYLTSLENSQYEHVLVNLEKYYKQKFHKFIEKSATR